MQFGYFSFGGSTVICVFEKVSVIILCRRFILYDTSIFLLLVEEENKFILPLHCQYKLATIYWFLMLEYSCILQDTIKIDDDLLANSKRSLETLVSVGMQLGVSTKKDFGVGLPNVEKLNLKV